MSILPYQQGDVVLWDGQTAVVDDVRGERIVLRTMDDMTHIVAERRLREYQPRRPAA